MHMRSPLVFSRGKVPVIHCNEGSLSRCTAVRISPMLKGASTGTGQAELSDAAVWRRAVSSSYCPSLPLPSLPSLPSLPMDDVTTPIDDADAGSGGLSTPTVRLFAVLEAMTRLSAPFTLQAMVQATGLPKPSVHRMLQQLEAAGIVQRDGDERHYGMGRRLRQIANGLLLNDSLAAARHRILQQLCEAVGESCNLTALSSGEVVYLDRVETAAPLRFYLHPGSRVPVHCSATGKLFLGQLSRRQRQLLLGDGPLERQTKNTRVDPQELEAEIEHCRRRGYSVDNEEFLPGLICFAVLVPARRGKSNLGIAMQGPSMRISVEQIDRYLPHLRHAAQALAALEDTAD